MSESKTKNVPLLAVLAVLALIGLCAWIFQQMRGLSVTGMDNLTSWGTYICMFMLFVGLSAGGLIVASAASVFNIEQFKAIAKPAIALSTACIVAAGLFVLVDLGGIQRVWRMLTGPNFASPLMWDMIVITCYLVLNIAYLDLYTRPAPNAARIKAVSFVALPVAVLVHSVTAWIFGLEIARDWYSSIMAPLFVASALDSGLALLLITLAALAAKGLFATGKDLFTMLAGLLAVFVAFDAFMVGCEILTMAYPGGEQGAYLAQLAFGPTAPFFWFEVVCGLAIPFAMLAPRKQRENRALVVAASCLVVLGVFCKRVWLLFTAFQVPNIDAAPGVTVGNVNLAGSTAYAMLGTYAPTLVEFAVAVGVISLCALGYLALVRRVLLEGNAPVSPSAVSGEAA